jgi:hypothetical protein
MPMTTKAMTFFKAGAWILVAAGFAHALIAVFDIWMQGAFSPLSGDVITAMKNTTLGIVDFGRGYGTSFFGTAWSAFIGFTIGVGLLIGFIGLLLVIILKQATISNDRFRTILAVAAIMSAIMTVISVICFFYLPTTLLGASLICFIIAWICLRREVYDAP